MYFILFAIMIGVIIGAFTNIVAIKMLFRPYKPWKIAGWQLPFTPGLIPKRREKIAEQLGYMVENYLFTAKGMKSFMEATGMMNGFYEKILNKLKEKSEATFGDILSKFFTPEWKNDIKGYKKEKLHAFMEIQKENEALLGEVISEQTASKIEEELEKLAEGMIGQLKVYVRSIEGRRVILGKIKEFITAKKMLSYFASFIIEGNQFQDKLFIYIEQMLEQEDTKKLVKQVMINKWFEIKKESVGSIISKYDEMIEEIDGLIDGSIDNLAKISFGEFLDELEERKVLRRIYDEWFEILIAKIDRLFPYLSIHKIVRDEVNRFSLKELEKMIVEIANKELRMITYMGGLLGGTIGLLQGLIYTFMQF